MEMSVSNHAAVVTINSLLFSLFTDQSWFTAFAMIHCKLDDVCLALRPADVVLYLYRASTSTK